ncbi:putative phosphatidylethanolamine-binding protein [Desulfosarcina variabilis str. Montpellier]|uniref:hypothetical protein n=1 Tax=Desulfosarcina variabilis TaxID=2300 RepID=UPI003AFAA665
MKNKIFQFFIALSVIYSCNNPESSEKEAILKVEFQWTENSSCKGLSPPIRVLDIPQNTSFLKVNMIDLDMPAVKHGGGEIPYDGSSKIKEGALDSYYGPCPLPGSVHSYEITVQALASDDKTVISQGKAIRKYPD